MSSVGSDVYLAKSYDHLFKLLLIGDSGVGKTCLLFRFSDDSFNSNFISTIGIDFKIKTLELEGRRIRLQIWDTAGQERFHTITTSYYHGAMGIMLVYDVTNQKSFDNIHKWLNNITQHAKDDVNKLLVANKCDLNEKRVITREKGEECAFQNDIPFIETSAKSNINISQAFQMLTEAVLHRVVTRNLQISNQHISNISVSDQSSNGEMNSSYSKCLCK